jgi:hypothetical protein
MGWSVERISELTRIDPFFLDQFAELVEFEDDAVLLRHARGLARDLMLRAKRLGYSDAQLANLSSSAISPPRDDPEGPRSPQDAGRSSRCSSWWTPAPRSSRR